jgi:Fur family ferric uptake transcriptional regulator
MTRAPEVARLCFTDLSEAVDELRRRGLRLSASRRRVLAALFAAEGPCSAEHLARGLDLDLTSVYRNLDMLERHGLAQHVHLGHGPGLYALVGSGEHEYLYCERCSAVRVLAPAELDPLRVLLNDRFGYRARFTHHAIVGVCPACAAEDAREAPPGRQANEGDAHSHGDHVHAHTQPHDDLGGDRRGHRHRDT